MIKFFTPLFEPLGFIWLLLVVATVWAARKHLRGLAIFLGTICLLILLIGSTPMSKWLVGSLERPYIANKAVLAPVGDVVLMLGGTHHPSRHAVFGMGLNATADRIITSVELVRQKKGQALVLGGGGYIDGGKQDTEARLLQNWIEQWKVLEAPVMVLGICQDTHGEAVRMKALAAERGWKRILLVTSASHMKRAEAVFRKEGLRVIPVACNFEVEGDDFKAVDEPFTPFPKLDGFVFLSRYLHEKIGWWVYRLRGWID